MLGYLSKIFVLIKGWLCFLFKSAVDVESILQKTWLVKSGTLMLKHWHITFNPVKEHFRYRHLWVLLPGCPLVFWNLEAFRVIENALGKFLHADPKVLEGSDMRMGRIVVEMDLIDGLPVDLDIEWCGFTFQQRLDYMGVPFRCVIYKGTGRLRHQCLRSFSKLPASGKGEVEPKTKGQTKFDAVWSDFLSSPSLDSAMDSGKLFDKEPSLPLVMPDFIDSGSKGLMIVKALDESVTKRAVGGAISAGVDIRACCREGFLSRYSELSVVVEKVVDGVGGGRPNVDGLSDLKLKVAGDLREQL
jgi:hypothetical protein